ncbi:MAG: Magnesium and cobalt efflux protein CorC [Labilithrix sp.]|nr:Magnesium and cobalt efflux protein CorC [Labilithrix sp.]
MSIPLGPIALAVVAAAVGSLFVSADAALTSLPEARLQALIEQDEDATFKRYASDPLRVLSRWLVARVVALSIASVVMSHALEPLLGVTEAAIASVGAAVLVYATSAEILSTIARRRPEQVGRIALRVLRPLELAVAPIAAPLALLGKWIGSKVPERHSASDARLTETEVEWLVDKGEKEGALEKEPATMIRNVLDFKHLTAREVMIPRRRVSSLEVSMPLADVLEHVRKDGHSRYPVFRETLDNVVGLLYVKDLFDNSFAGTADTKLEDLIRKPVLFVAEAQPALSVLREMRSKRLHLSVVTDEFGGTGGIVTLEDIIEEIVGEIRDEYDIDDPQIQKLADGRFIADAAIPLGDLEAHLGIKLPDDGAYESLGGLIIDRAGCVPEVGATVKLERYDLIVREADETRVVRVEIVRKEPTPTEADEGARS